MPPLRLLLVAAALVATGASLSAAPGGSSSGTGVKSGKKPSASEPGPRVVEPADRRAFYREGWRALLGRRIHLHVEAEVLRRAPEKFAGADGRPRWRFANRTVALVVDPGDPEWRKAMEDRDDASEFCLHGVVRLAPAGARALAQLDVDSIKRAPGSRRRPAHRLPTAPPARRMILRPDPWPRTRSRTPPPLRCCDVSKDVSSPRCIEGLPRIICGSPSSPSCSPSSSPTSARSRGRR